jgi:hypothetical protein
VDGETGAMTPDDEAKCHGKVTRKPKVTGLEEEEDELEDERDKREK